MFWPSICTERLFFVQGKRSVSNMLCRVDAFENTENRDVQKQWKQLHILLNSAVLFLNFAASIQRDRK